MAAPASPAATGTVPSTRNRTFRPKEDSRLHDHSPPIGVEAHLLEPGVGVQTALTRMEVRHPPGRS